jgi:hypothetical protein
MAVNRLSVEQLSNDVTRQAIQRQTGISAFVSDDVYYLPDKPSDLAPGQTAEISIKGGNWSTLKIIRAPPSGKRPGWAAVAGPCITEAGRNCLCGRAAEN